MAAAGIYDDVGVQFLSIYVGRQFLPLFAHEKCCESHQPGVWMVRIQIIAVQIYVMTGHIVIVIRSRMKFAYQTHYVGDVRYVQGDLGW